MRSFVRQILLCGLPLFYLTHAAMAEGECRACIRDKLAGTREQVAAAAAFGAVGGLSAGALPGAVCGAVLGAMGASVSKLIDVAQCDTICTDEAKRRKDDSVNRCTDLIEKVKN